MDAYCPTIRESDFTFNSGEYIFPLALVDKQLRRIGNDAVRR